MPGDMKARIADTLNELLEHKELDKITVKELVDACNISRPVLLLPLSGYYGSGGVVSGSGAPAIH